MKKTIILIVLIVTIFATSISAVDNDPVYTYSDDNIEICIVRNGLDDRQLNNIVLAFSGDTQYESQPTGLWCTLFGHDMKYTQADVTEHNYYSTAPHCRVVTYKVGACSRCDHTETEQISETRLSCH